VLFSVEETKIETIWTTGGFELEDMTKCQYTVWCVFELVCVFSRCLSRVTAVQCIEVILKEE